MHTTDIEQKIRKITEQWFLTEPLLFTAYCTHTLCRNDALTVPFRTGMGRIEFSHTAVSAMTEADIENNLKTEAIRIVLQHPYRRKPPKCDLGILTLASNITIFDSNPGCFYSGIPGMENAFNDMDFYCGRLKTALNLPDGLSFEEYYARLSDISAHISSALDSQAVSDAEQISELWEEDAVKNAHICKIIESARLTKKWGNISSSLQARIIAEMYIDTDYRRMLSFFRTSVLSSTRTLTRMKPNRRFGFGAMGSRYELKSNLLIAVDVSGSVSYKNLARFFSIINRFFKYGIEKLDVIQFDSVLRTRKPIELKKAQREVTILGRGGTSFQPAADYYCAHTEYDGLIYFTDGHAPLPVFNTKRHIDVLWILTTRKNYTRYKDKIRSIRKNRATYIPLPE